MTPQRKSATEYRPQLWEKVTVAGVAALIILLVGIVVLRNEPFADPNLVVVLRIVISLAVGSLGAAIPGFLHIDLKGKGVGIRAGGALALFVLTYVVTPEVQSRAMPASRKSSKLSLSLKGMMLCDPTSVIADHTFTGKDGEDVVHQAAIWVDAELKKRFHQADHKLNVQPSALLDKESNSYKLQLESDPLRQDLFWVFGQENKVGHLKLENSADAVEKLINKTRSPGNDDRVTGLLLHVDRPGYDLELLAIPIGAAAESKTLKWLGRPPTIVVGSVGNETVTLALRNRLESFGLIVGTSDTLKSNEKTYGRSLSPHLSAEMRLAFIREIRVNAFVDGAYTEVETANARSETAPDRISLATFLLHRDE